jgi:iron complex transport system ATP-binding protein
MSPVIAEDIEFFYGDQIILRRLSFSVVRGDFFIILGPNGSGKTTLLKIIANILKVKKGALRIMGNPIENHSRRSLARTLALVPQMAPVDFPFTVMELVLMGRSPHLGFLALERKNDLELAKNAMEFTGVLRLAHRKMDQLSGGEQQRVFIARAICQDPEIMLLDEPTASLDLTHQIRIMDLMEKLRKEKGLTIVMVSHDINLAAMYATRLLFLKAGKEAGIGTPEEVLTFKNLERIYECPLLVDESPLGGFKRITLIPNKFLKMKIAGK